MKHLASLALASALALSAGSAFAAEGYGDCPTYGPAGVEKVDPAVPGQFTVIINLPAVGNFNGDTPETIKDGYEFCMAVNIAHRLGLEKVVLKNASFDSIVAGQNKDFDIALALITVTEPRKKVVDFSTPYAFPAYGIAAKAGTKLTEETVKAARFGTQAGTTMVPYAQDVMKVQDLSVFDDTAAMFTAAAAGKVDAVMTELSIVLGQVSNSGGKLETIARIETGGQTAGIYPKGSAEKPVIDTIISDMTADGSLKKLQDLYLTPSFGGISPESIPLWKY